MKKVFLFLTTAAVALTTGCDSSCSMNFVIINEIESCIVIDMVRDNKRITIEPGHGQLIDQQGSLCEIYKENATMIHYADMQIEGTNMPKTIWISKYWDCIVGNPLTTYTLTVTDELIETLLSNNTTSLKSKS